MRKFGISLAVAFLTCGLWAQEKASPARGVTTTGTAEVNVVPDEVLLQVGVQNQSPRAKSAKAATDATSRRILTALKGLGIDAKDIQTAYLSLQPQFDYRKGMRISYFSAEHSLTVKLREVSQIDEVLDALIKAGGNRMDGIEYQSSELRKYRDQARDSAVKAAREKAEALAKALGQQIGKAYSIQEDQPQMYSPYANTVLAGLEADKSRAPIPSTSPGQMKVNAVVTVSFELI
jgi:uncharacterized protein YggE